ncbi:hypothetical protein [Aggregatibacter kilianii]|uniref:hypothetical protein n=1 Tax=Aggregatibacter kilianii TaxID=2025884 RepID=UPI001EF914FD|nr:hypothetical protein [Aggregatibacter kilianii]
MAKKEIQTTFDWEQADFYRYTPAMLDGTRAGRISSRRQSRMGGRYKTEYF